MTTFGVGCIINAMDEENKKEIEIHRYGLRMPKNLFTIIENLAWESRLSINFMLNELIVEALGERLRAHEIDVSLALYTGREQKDGFKKIDYMNNENPEKVKDLELEYFDTFREYRDWKETST